MSLPNRFYEQLQIAVPQHPKGRPPRLDANGKAKKGPVDVVPVPEIRIVGRAFFPGGDGLWEPTSNPIGGVMLVGNIFGCVQDFEESRERGHEDMRMRTWEGLRRLTDGLIAPRNCFYTNAYPGLLEGEDNDAGFLRPAWYQKDCAAFMRWQMEQIQPRVVLTLGPGAVNLCGRAFRLDGWRNTSIASLDRKRKALVEDDTKRVFVALFHPSFWWTERNGEDRWAMERTLLGQALARKKTYE